MESNLSRLFKFLETKLYLDSRSIFLARVILAITCIYDLFLNYSVIEFYAADKGIFPTQYFNLLYQKQFLTFSLFYFNYSAEFITFVLFAGLFFSVTFLFNFYSRLSLIALLVIFQSLNIQYFTVGYLGDNLRTILLVFFLLLTFSKEDSAQKRSFSAINLFFFYQLSIMYFFSFYNKMQNPTWGKSFTALENIFHQAYFNTGLLEILNPSSLFLKILTASSLVLISFLALTAPLLLFFQRSRIWLCLLGIAFHLSLSFFLQTEALKYYSIIFWILILPPATYKKFDFEPKLYSSFNSLITPISFLLIIVITAGALGGLGNDPFSINHHLSRYQLNQNWTLFSNSSATSELASWTMIVGKKSGEEINLLKNDQPPIYVKPKKFSDIYPNISWQHFLITLRRMPMRKRWIYVQHISKYFCKKHSVTNSPLIYVDFVLLRENANREIQKISHPFKCTH